ncbi:MAB_1171c family putative transporter [Streptomyces virginiae]|uniref:MAB_1171c family putative transporter n=2 Tax=Streptomyces TaxID=1883 RepID=UPI00386C64A5
MRPFDLVVLPLIWVLTAWSLLGLRRAAGRDRGMRALWAMWALWAVAFTVGVPAVRRVIDAVLGVASVTNLLVHLLALAATSAMVEFVRELTGRSQGRPSRVNLIGLAVAMALLTSVFAVMPRPNGDVDLLTYSQNSPAGFLYWIIVTGVVAIGLAACAVLCWIHGSHAHPGPVRTSLWLMRLSMLLGTIYLAHRLAYLTARYLRLQWFDSAVVRAITQALLVLTLLLLALSVLWPALAGHRQRRIAARQGRRIAPLWRLLQTATPEVVLALPDELHRGNPRLRLYRYVIEVRDSILALEGHVGAAHVAAAEAQLRAAGFGGDRLAPAVEAAVLRYAIAAELGLREKAFDRRAVAGDGRDLDSEIRWIAQVAAVIDVPAVVLTAERLYLMPGVPLPNPPGQG